MIDETNKTGLMEFLKNLSLPEWVSKNILTALGKGIQGIIIEASEIPKTSIRNYTERLKLIGEIKRDLIRRASEHQLNQIDIEPDLAKRALENHGIQLIEEQLNKETIVARTIQSLKTIETPSEQHEKLISPDWLTSFWNLAGTKSEDEIQEILSKILANEILQPGSLSLHTLQTLSILNSKVGNSFSKLCNLSIEDLTRTYFIHPNVFPFQNVGDLQDYEISFNDLLDLDGANLIRSAETIRLNFASIENLNVGEYDYEVVDYASKKAKLDVSGKQLNLIYFTQAGRELRRLIKMTPVAKYTDALSKHLGDNFKLE
ncbi:hypothetical protein CNR22_06195 [Sphingobacteriaceae bacterium]|nr:hypothetical protein CNR22_06195 [Sphingobacteriaceae bacterium]